MIWVTPGSIRPGWEECNISSTKPMFDAFLIGHESFTRDDEVGLVLVIVPFVARGAALPDYDVRNPVIGSDQQLASRLGIAA